MNKLFFIAVIFCSHLIMAQMPTPTSNLTIFSEDGNKFFLILNGERQNDLAQTNIRIEDLQNPYYNAKIIFADKTKGEISKNYLMVTDADGVRQDVTYKVKADKNGKQILRYFSAIPVAPNMPPSRPQGVAVYQFGHPAAEISIGSTTVTQTTTTTQGMGTNVGVNVGGIGVNINVNDPLLHQTTTTQTITTIDEPVVQRPGQPAPRPNVHAGCQGYPMNANDFTAAKAAIADASFEETKLSTAKQIGDNNCLYTNQIMEICEQFGFEETKLNFAKYAFARCYDRSNYFKVNKVFGFDASKQELSKFTSGK